jgi:GNAT superfamily N-acetyltransferase
MATDRVELTLRPFVESDEDEVTSWFADAGELRFFAGKRLTWPLDAGQWRSIRLDPSVSAWTGVSGDDPIPVSHGELIEESPAVVRLARLAVVPRERGHGVGRWMVASLIERSRASGHSLITLTVHQDNSTAIRGYRGLGFTPVGTAPAHADLRMELALD